VIHEIAPWKKEQARRLKAWMGEFKHRVFVAGGKGGAGITG